MTDLHDDVVAAKRAQIALAALDGPTKDRAMAAMAGALEKGCASIIQANRDDIAGASELGQAMLKRLLVDDEKIASMAEGIRSVAKMQDPVGRTLSAMELDDGLDLYQVSCPIGVLGVIFESRPDVVPQIMSLCLKSGNAVIFKGGREADRSNTALFTLLSEAAYAAGVPRGVFVLMHTREDVGAMLKMDGLIDLIIPRGSYSFVRYIQENTRIPVMGHAAGICHVYVDAEADLDKALDVALDSKVQYPAVCNAMETLLVNATVAGDFLPEMDRRFHEHGVEIRADERAIAVMLHAVPASEKDWDTEYDDLIISVKVVNSVEEAMAFINAHGSHHTDAIITENKGTAMSFARMVDSADVFINASTRFADGYRFGKGAEVGISTGKIHARGPVGMEGLMIYKYILVGNGQVVKDYVGKGARRYTHVPIGKRFGE
jgi:glutamate-5-semialdehyde dehydrogenase